tara:strand:- start:242 stop:616 length:375 start_codon:yes stop_codon:yes gene_type:complete
MKKNQLNVLGQKLVECSQNPITGFTRNGCCEANSEDFGKHIICAVMNEKFLNFQNAKGNDLITPKKEYDFPGLSSGDKWCVCANRWLDAYNYSCATSIILSSTHIDVLEIIDIEILKKFALDLN